MPKFLKQETVPEDKHNHMSTRGNSDYKWQKTGVVGAFEVVTEPDLNVKLPLTPLETKDLSTTEERWNKAKELWKSLKLRESFVQACEGVPVETTCCGLITDDAETLNKLLPHLNEHWAPKVNEILKDDNFKIDAYLWHWSNISGASEQRVLLIRFYDVSRASSD
uniref:Uncharacterized protein n=1 Tax=Grammatophora oceanica TaxID=210454 RepID=A0A7S1ULT0_9STRA|mmetsp:Transcript_11621/g.17037  ORF Transcript_11621/g.17037 Transcript_11621/m.17037 type:complete len:165 (+) Transcript_11621:99-593(+)